MFSILDNLFFSYKTLNNVRWEIDLIRHLKAGDPDTAEDFWPGYTDMDGQIYTEKKPHNFLIKTHSHRASNGNVIECSSWLYFI